MILMTFFLLGGYIYLEYFCFGLFDTHIALCGGRM